MKECSRNETIYSRITFDDASGPGLLVLGMHSIFYSSIVRFLQFVFAEGKFGRYLFVVKRVDSECMNN